MANLPETPDYPAGVYQIETSDPVLGGPGGIANLQAEQLGNRTAWLKAKIDAFLNGTVAVLKATKLATARTLSISGAGSGNASFDGSANANIVLTLADSGAVAGTYPKVTVNAKGLVTSGSPLTSADIPASLALTGTPTAPTAAAGTNSAQLANTAFVQAAVAALVASSPGALDTLNELAAALGNDPNFATTVTNALAAKAPLASPVFTGNPTCPTPPQFDNDQSLVNSAFLQRALGNYRTFGSLLNGTVISEAHLGGFFQPVDGGSVLFPTPASLGAPSGSTVTIAMLGRGSATIQGSGGATFAMNLNGITSFGLVRGQTVVVTAINGTEWAVLNNLRYDDSFSSSLVLNGYQKLPSGQIEQWGTVSVPAGNSPQVITLPITFPNAILAGVCSFAGVSQGSCGIALVSTSQISFTNSHSAAQVVRWIVKGN
ncbi:hypothetical protein [Pseudomonas sp. BN515]|uniref:gp53-like domain-containing protein n=1 Tax=Pseudomonas sp. BN515 TaxID=2567892 RepID=UPI002456684F|nr:hypothetical protein [Pseudomonas sp. BN515]